MRVWLVLVTESVCMHRVISEMMRILSARSWTPASLFALIVFAFFFSTSSAGRQGSFLTVQDDLRQHGEVYSRKIKLAVGTQHGEAAGNGGQKEAAAAALLVHARMLNVKTNDYGSYDPSPSMDKPHFKLIPN